MPKKDEFSRFDGIAEAVVSRAERAFNSERSSFQIVVYLHENEKIELLRRIHARLREHNLTPRELSPSHRDEHVFTKLYSQITEASKGRMLSLVTDVPRGEKGMGPDTDFLQYLNIHRDTIAREHLRFVLFLHEPDVEPFMRMAGDLWDFRSHTYWLNEDLELRKDKAEGFSWLDEAAEDIDKNNPEAGEVADHLARTRKLLEETAGAEDRANLLLSLTQWFQRRNMWEEAIKAAREGLAQLEESDASSLKAQLENGIGYMLKHMGHSHQALEHYKKSLGISREVGDRWGEGAVLNNISQIYSGWGKYDQALKALEESLAILQEVGDRKGEGAVLNNISQIYSGWGKYDQALKALEKSLAIRREVGDRQGEGVTLNNISQIYDGWGKYDQALKALEESLAILREVGDRQGEGVTLNNISQIYRTWGKYDQALKALEESLAIRREVGDRKGEGVTLNNIASTYHRLGKFAQALKALEESLAIRQEVGDRQGEGVSCGNLSVLWGKMGNHAKSEKYARLSREILSEIGHDDATWAKGLIKGSGVVKSIGKAEPSAKKSKKRSRPKKR
ncbi:tetratricopeptide repeat protein [bacterium]|nr:MAG: tetratricopeptide repeat protein [bacterium]